MIIEHMRESIESRLDRKIDDKIWDWFTEVDDTWEYEAIEFLAQAFEEREAEITLILANIAAGEATQEEVEHA